MLLTNYVRLYCGQLQSIWYLENDVQYQDTFTFLLSLLNLNTNIVNFIFHIERDIDTQRDIDILLIFIKAHIAIYH